MYGFLILIFWIQQEKEEANTCRLCISLFSAGGIIQPEGNALSCLRQLPEP
ncbi:MAG: hypothetical protein U0K35_06275 [Prevotella sp.]|nr:hypothetical protein [Prevotella sp.]